MTTITLLSKIITAPCEAGQCGGQITLATNGNTGYAFVEPDADHGYYVEQDCDYILRNADRSITVSCGAVHPDTEETCTGSAVFTAEAIEVAEYVSSPLAGLMRRMEEGE